ncbi:glycine zipper family protein [Chryseobacterium nematophagum]|uniref:Glycine zipper family protein n=1 Tax=Chryseobacterium nematophagum TaxID=2305228 RepID=A0A3M7LDH7_9FLAO|nr:glycine zipper family protein [Chryseobacterium nematophagum]RMZ60781.1 glycine zipper family protein [Chryseobacterium nematophagum]
MKQTLLLFLLLFSNAFFAQRTETIDLSKSIKNTKNAIKTFTVIDERPNKEIGAVMYHKDPVNIVFEKDGVTDIKDWFYKSNPVRGNDELVLLLENIEISEEKKEKSSIGKLTLKASTFIKKEDGYHFLYRTDTIASVSSRTTPYLAQTLAKKITICLTELFKSSYKVNPWKYAISENELTNYNSLLKNNLELYKNDQLEEGAYMDYYSFFTQTPEAGFRLVTNKKGEVTKAVNGTEKITLRKMYAFTLNGRVYKNLPLGSSTEILKDEKGFFIMTSKAALFPNDNARGAMIGAMTGGLVGAMVGGIIDASISSGKKIKNGDLKVYLDPFTGNYIFEEEDYKFQ